MSAEQKEALVRAFHSSLLQGENYERINQARKQAEAILGQSILPGSPLTKVVDEAMEAAVVRVAPSLIQQCTTTHQAYDRLVGLLNRQPTLGVRSSTSILQQAYSTPIPIAYFAATLAGITGETTVYEPTAGNGALLVTANPAKAIANELNPDRFTELKNRGYAQLTQYNATHYRPQEQVDVMICNPPFGPVQDENGKVRRFVLPGNRRGTRQVDHEIAFKALEAIKDNGRAVLILGGKLGDDEDLRSNRYNSIESRGFFFSLYQHYNVTQHFSIWGNLYRKQGAGFPIDVILIEGRGQSQRDLPAAEVPIIYKSFDALKERLPDERIQHRGLQPLLTDLEATRGGRSNPVSGQASNRDTGIILARLPTLNDAQNSVDDSSLVGGERRESNSNAPPTDPSPQSAIDTGTADAVRRRSGEETGTAVVVDRGVGRNLRSTQRSLGDPVPNSQRADVSDSDRSSFSRDPTGMDAGTRRDHVRELAISVDLRNERIISSSDPTPETQIMANPDLERPTPTDAPLNVAYLPRSQGKSPGTLIPSNMATAAQTALDKLERAVGNVDEYVQHRLGYESKEELWKYLYAEQIDANALAFWQRDRIKVFLNGDQTGNGKGRFCASQIVDAVNQGYIPVFITQKSTLYVSMLADLKDIGKPGINIFATDNNLRLDLPNGSKLRTGNPAEQEMEMQRIMQQGIGAYNAIFTTYSQLQTIDSGKEPFRRNFLREIAPNAIFIFDEAHEAGGSTGEKGWTSSSDAPNRAEFARELIDLSAGAVFASATAIKDPAVMDLYARRSDAAEAVASIESLQRTLKVGGVPLQQMMATKFVASGQMLRRERSFENVAFQAKVVPVDRDVADNISAIMRAISQFDLAKEKAVAKLSKELKKEAKAASEDSSIGQAGARSTNFTSLMNNAIDQGLLCQKAEATVQEAIAAIERGQKPVIAVANTMDAFIGQYAEDNGLEPGDAINISFGDVLSRYLERSRDVTIKDHEGNTTRRRMTNDELTEAALAAYESAREIIDATDLSTIPLSSIDYIKWRLTQAGYRVDEITGRHNIIDYTVTGEQGYARRSANETKPQARVQIVDQFNAGQIDVLILNRAGATGINLHASEKFADQKQRHLIMAQAERDINQVMQMLGRVNRFGQVTEPEITLLMSDIPAEKRLGALLSHKMATLNANTTADRDSALSIANVVDFLTPYGEEVIHEILDDNPELEAKLAYPRNSLQGDSDIEAISRITGRIPLLSVKEQEELYALLESETLDLMAQKQAMGESVLEAQQLDLDARTIGRMEVIPDEGMIRNEFTGPVYLDVVDAKIPVKPLNQLEVINLVREHLGLEAVKQVADHNFDQVERTAKDQAQLTSAKLRQATRDYRTQLLPSKLDTYSRNKLTERLNTQFAHIRDTLRQFPSGQTVRVVSPEGNVTYGVVARIWQKGHNGSPTAPSNWKAQILTDNQARMLTVPLTRFNRGKTESLITISAQEKNWDGQDIYETFDLRQTADRTERQIFQGNLLKAYEKYPTGKFLNYTDHQGNVRQGLVMPASFDIQESLREQPVPFSEPHQVKAFMTELTNYQGSVKTLDEVLTIKSQASARFGSTAAGFVLQTPKSAIGDRFSLDQSIIATAGNEFYSISERMELIVPTERIDRVLTILMKEQGQTLAAFDFKDKAREFLGVKLPELEVVADEPAREEPVQKVQKPPQSEARAVVDPIQTPQHTIKSSSNQPTGSAEKNVTRFLRQSGLLTPVLEAEDFHLRIEHDPYIPLVIERHGNQLYLTHYLEQNGDTFIDTEMVFRIQENHTLKLEETAVQNPLRGGEHRSCDRSFAKLFSQNILDQGFAQAARAFQSEIMSQTPEEELEQPELFALAQYESIAAISSSDPTWATLEQPKQHQEPETTQSITSVDLPVEMVTNSSWKTLADSVRDFALLDLAAQFGLEQDRSDRAKWRSQSFCISINDNKFFDHYAGKGGSGAIDFTMHVRNCSFQEAVEQLARERPTHSSQISKQEEKRPKCNIRDETKWGSVRNYLVNERGLPADQVDRLHMEGLLSADSRQNVMVFRHQLGENFQRGEAIGANLRGTIPNAATGEIFKGLTPGTAREDGYFWFQQGEGQIDRVVITESAIDAISYASLNKFASTTVFLSTDGQGAIPVEALHQVIDREGEIILAHDRDRQGEHLAWQIVQQYPDVVLEREAPTVGKDWNDQLLGKAQEDSRSAITEQLWNWYRLASTEQRQEIVQIGLEVHTANNPRELTTDELQAVQNSIESGWGQEILTIAQRAYAYAENLGVVKPDETGETWIAIGNGYDLSYNPLDHHFLVVSKENEPMQILSINGVIQRDSTQGISETNVMDFRETEKYLNEVKFQTAQTPAQTQAIAQGKQEQSQKPELSSQSQQQPSLEDLRNWYQKARDAGRSDRHLKQIELVGKAFVQGQPLSERDLQMMAKDMATWERQAQAIAEQAKLILTELGQPLAEGIVFPGKTYLLYAQDKCLYALAPERGKQPKADDQQVLPESVLQSGRGIILKLEDGVISAMTQVTSADAQRFGKFVEQMKQRTLRKQSEIIGHDR